MKFILGVKKNMTQVFDGEGKVIPATIVGTGPLTVTQVKNDKIDGYSAVQFGFGNRKEKNINKAVKGHTKDLGCFQTLREYRVEDEALLANLKVGDKIDLTTFKEGDGVCVSGISKGKGFQGVIKRHGFAGQPRTHGQKHSERAPGSISGGTRCGGRVPKGMRMGGRTGFDKITVSGLKIVQIDTDKNEILVSGALPGRRGTILEIMGE